MIGRLVVTGSSGFIGRAVIDTARRQGLAVRAASRRRLEMADVETVRVTDYRQTPVEREDTVIHLAETRDVAGAAPAIPAALDVMKALLAKRPRVFVYASSAVVYGDGMSTPRRPGDAATGTGAYADGKRAAEALVDASGGIVARLSNVYGSGMSERSVVAQILAQIPGEGALTVRAASPVRDFLWVADAAEGLLALVRKAKAGTFNIGSGVGTSIHDLARLALVLAGEGHRPIVEAAPDARASHLVLDIAETREATGWGPRTPLAEGLSFCLGGAC